MVIVYHMHMLGEINKIVNLQLSIESDLTYHNRACGEMKYIITEFERV